MNIVFAGTPQFAAGHLQAMVDAKLNVVAVITQPDRPGKRGKRPVPGAVKVLAESLGLPVRQPERLTTETLKDLAPDLMVVVAYGQILRTPVLSLPTYGCINVHASMLPRWRGAAPIQRALLAGDDTTGVCVMQMDKGLDTGAVYTTREVAIDAGDTAATLADKLLAAGGGALLETISDIAEGRAKALPQPETGETYAHKITKAEAAIDWQQPAIEISRAIRAFNPDPVAFSFLDDMRVKFWQASVATTTNTAACGEIIDVTKRGVIVSCGEGAINVTAMQLPVGKGSILSANDILNARRDLVAKGRVFHA